VERCAGLHMDQLMPLPLMSLASVKSRLVLPFWYQLTWVVPDKGPLNGFVFVCVCVCVRACARVRVCESSDGHCCLDLTRRIGLTCLIMTSLKWIWSDKRLTLNTKLCIYQTLVLCVLSYATDTWTLLSADVRTLDAFHQKCLRV